MKINVFKKTCSELRDDAGARNSFRQRIQRRLMDHVASCPTCQRRLSLTNRVEIAISLVKSQPQHIELLSRANTSALKVLKHSLRFSSKSDKLRQVNLKPRWIQRFTPIFEQVLNVAACIFVLLMIRFGIFSSLTNYKQQGQTVLHNYYANNLDSQLMDEIFPDADQNTKIT